MQWKVPLEPSESIMVYQSPAKLDREFHQGEERIQLFRWMPTNGLAVACDGKGTYQVALLCKSDPQLYY